MNKVYINDKPIVFADVYKELEAGESNYLKLSDQEFSIEDVKEKLAEENVAGIIYLSDGADVSWQMFVKNYTLIEAAGGLVKNDKGEYLIIYRKDRWDLPKGKLDYDETPEGAAIREIGEECGVDDLEILNPIIKTFHTYSEKSKGILKKTHWFNIVSTDKNNLRPQSEEGIEQAVWMSKERIQTEVFPNTYATIREVIKKGFNNS